MTEYTDEQQRTGEQERPTVKEAILRAFQVRPDWFAKRVLARLDGYLNPEACWVWQGCTRYGYGVTHTPKLSGQRTVLVHRVVWLALRGELTDGLVLDHDGPNGCHNKACANPDHLQEVTQYVNLVVTGTGACADHARRTHCPRGHPLEGDNLNPSNARRGWRACMTCTLERRQVIMRAAHSLGMSRRQYFAEYGYSQETAKSLLAERGYLDRPKAGA